jgi:hypothetical protein
VIVCAKGRDRQSAAGAASASGDLILFLHADTLLPPDAGGVLARYFARPEVSSAHSGSRSMMGAQFCVSTSRFQGHLPLVFRRLHADGAKIPVLLLWPRDNDSPTVKLFCDQVRERQAVTLRA